MPPDPRTGWRDAQADDGVGADFFRPRGDAACPPPELVQALRADVLPEDLRAHLAMHVESCAVCRALGQALDESVEGLTPEEQARILARVRAGAGGSPEASARHRWWLASAAAVLVAAVGMGAMLVSPFRREAAPEPPTAPPAPRAPAPVLSVEPSAVRLPSVVGLPSRGSPETAEREHLIRALEPYRTRQYAEAARRLNAFVRRYPRSAEGQLYLGVGNLLLYRDEDAVTALEAAARLAKNDVYLLHESDWYLALAYRRRDQVEQARAKLVALCRSNHVRAARACAGIGELAIRHRLTGVVTAADGTPLSGVSVGEYVSRTQADYSVAFTTRFSGATDGNGEYFVSGPLVRPARNVAVRASKPGYFSALKVVTASEHMRVDLVLDPWVHISLGDVVRGTVKADDPHCSDPGEPCRRFALTVPASGTLDVSVASANRADFDLYVETPAGEVFGPFMHAPLRVAIPARAASTFVIRVLRYGTGSAEFELATRLR
jgi:hypothetical protein